MTKTCTQPPKGTSQWLPIARLIVQRGYADHPGEWDDRTSALCTCSGLHPNTARAIFRYLDAND